MVSDQQELEARVVVRATMGARGCRGSVGGNWNCYGAEGGGSRGDGSREELVF